MSQQIINVGGAPDDHTGDPIRTAFTKANTNFSELYSIGGSGVSKAGDTMTGDLSSTAFIPTGTVVPTYGMYKSNATIVGISANGNGSALLVDSVGVGIGGRFGDSLFSINQTWPAALAAGYGFRFLSTIPVNMTGNTIIFQSAPSTAAAAFTLGSLQHYVAQHNTLGAGSAITVNTGFLASGSLGTAGATAYGFYGALAAGTNKWNLFMNGTARNYMAGALSIGNTLDPGTGGLNVNGKVGFGPSGVAVSSGLLITTPTTGGSNAQAVRLEHSIQSDVTTIARSVLSLPNTAAAAFTLGALNHFEANQGPIGAGSTVTTQRGFFAESSLAGAASNIGFYGNVAASATNWNFYANGAARNFMFGALSIGATTDPGTSGLYVVGPFVSKPPASVTPANNGEMVFQLTSNTSLVIKVKGSDGTVRSATLTLA